MGKGGFIDSSNADKTFAGIHSAMGEIEGLTKATKPTIIMSNHEMIGEDDDI